MVRRALVSPIWWDADDRELARALDLPQAYVARARADVRKELRASELAQRAAVARERLGLPEMDLFDVLVAALDVLERSTESRSEAMERLGATETPAEPFGRLLDMETGDDALRKSEAHQALADAYRALAMSRGVGATRSRADHRALSGGGGSRSRTESVAYREAAAGERRETGTLRTSA